MALMLALSVENTKAFVKGTATTRARPFSTELYADAKKKTAKKSDVETLRKPELLAQVADKMETSKAGADAAVTAVLDTIVEVSNRDIERDNQS